MSYCTDTCCRPAYEGPEYLLLASTMHTARKARPCFHGCEAGITVGGRYRKVVEVVDGEFSAHETCLPCVTREWDAEYGWDAEDQRAFEVEEAAREREYQAELSPGRRQ